MIRPLTLTAMMTCAAPAIAADLNAVLTTCKAGDVNACQLGAAAALERLDAKLNFAFVDQGCTLRDARACETLGEFYRHGIGTQQNYRRAYRFSKVACRAGLAEGCLRVGFLYNEGQGVAQSKAKAQSYYRKACDLGYSGPVC